MVSCVICKLGFGQIDSVSFHKLPKNEVWKAKWFMAIGREISKHCRVCSRHFEETDLLYKVVKDTVRRYLKPGACPSLLLTDHFMSDENMKISVLDESPHNDTIKEEPVSDDEYDLEQKPIIIMDIGRTTENLSLKSDENIENSVLGESPYNVIIKEEPISEADYMDRKPIVVEETINNSTLNRKANPPLTGTKKFHIPRSIGELRREDFASDLSWRIVQIYVQETRKKIKTLNKRVTRLNARIERFKRLT